MNPTFDSEHWHSPTLVLALAYSDLALDPDTGSDSWLSLTSALACGTTLSMASDTWGPWEASPWTLPTYQVTFPDCPCPSFEQELCCQNVYTYLKGIVNLPTSNDAITCSSRYFYCANIARTSTVLPTGQENHLK